jgi:hypothetical protein
MSDHPRELVPRSVYLTLDAIAEAERRAADASVQLGTLLRRILLGLEPPLVVAQGRGPHFHYANDRCIPCDNPACTSGSADIN